MSMLVEHHLYIMIAAAVGLIFLPSEWRKNKLFMLAAVLLVFSIGYELIMKEPVTKMPGRINRILNEEPPPSHSENVKYYRKPDID
jgi:hypothetical protein